ncbi:MAG TPA: prephenate dehydrogenase, partial [Candidatus Eremiobacteraceae bacterium]|nr:prephenate dehydrogenase [Candidatus Eremiobacteraceae bacterium]
MSRSATRPPRRVAILGLGLIGTSIGLALKADRRSKVRIAGWDPKPPARNAARSRGGIDEPAKSALSALRGAGVIILSAPLEAVIAAIPAIIACAEPGALVMDVAPLAQPVVTAARRALHKRPDVLFVSGHPMAGSEHSGAAHADAHIFTGRPFAIVAPAQARRRSAIEAAQRVVRSLGARPVLCTPSAHDRAVAATSALPQLVSLAAALAVDEATPGSARSLVGPGYRDVTRLARSLYEIWRSALAANQPSTSAAARIFTRWFARIQRALRG